MTPTQESEPVLREVRRRLDSFHSPSFDREIVEKLLALAERRPSPAGQSVDGFSARENMDRLLNQCDIPTSDELEAARQALARQAASPASASPSPDAYDKGRRDVLNAILALNPRAAQRLHMISGGTEETFNNHAGQIPFDVAFWVTEVAEQLGIKSKEELAEAASPSSASQADTEEMK